MLEKITSRHRKFRTERSAELAAACDITQSGLTIEFYDLAMNRVFAKSTVFTGKSTLSSACKSIGKNLEPSLSDLNVKSTMRRILPKSKVFGHRTTFIT